MNTVKAGVVTTCRHSCCGVCDSSYTGGTWGASRGGEAEAFGPAQ